MPSTCCPRGGPQHLPWTDYPPSVQIALFYSTCPTVIQPVNLNSLFKTAQASHLLWSLSWPLELFSSCPHLMCLRHTAVTVPATLGYTCLLVHLPKVLWRQEMSLVYFCATVPTIWPGSVWILQKYVLIKFYYITYLATSFYFSPIKTFWAPTLCQVLCYEIGYAFPGLKDRNSDTPSDQCCDRGVCWGLRGHRGGT